jgi:chemotaxis protein methyltransferase CheR
LRSIATSSVPERLEGASETPLERLRAWIAVHLGIRFEDAASSALLGGRIAMAFGAGEQVFDEVLSATLRGDREVISKLAEATSTNHTAFFREPETFHALAREILPSLPRGEALRLWSAAASSGEESYSMAIVADRVLGEDASRVRILGTDISERQLRVAEHAVYAREAVAVVPDGLRSAFVHADELHVRVASHIRQRCVFRRLNLVAQPWPFAKQFHVIFLRNVLYYFDPQVRRQIIEACYDVAAPQGWLVLGLSEPLLDLQTRWSPVGPGLFRKESGR